MFQKSGCSCRDAMCRTPTTAAPRASSRSSIWWRPRAATSWPGSKASALFPGFDLDELVVLRRRLRALAARPARVRRLLFGLRLYRCLRAVGLDHHQPGAFEIFLRVDGRRLRAGGQGRLRPRFHRSGFLPLRFLAHHCRSGLNGLWRLDRGRYWRILVAAFAVPVAPMPASAAALLVAFALRWTLLLLCLRGLWRARRTLLLRPAFTARRLPVTTLLEPPLLLAIASATALAALLLVRSRIAPLLGVASRLAGGCWRRNALDGSRRWRRGLSLEPAEEAIDDSGARFARSSLHRGGLGLRRSNHRLRPRLGHRRRLIRRDALDHRDLAFALRLGFFAGSLGLLGPLDQLVARRHVFHFVQLVVPQSLYFVVRRLEVRVRHQHDVDLEPRLELLDLGALLVEEERRHVHRYLRVYRAGVLLHRLLLQDPQHVQRRRLGAADEAGAAAARTADVRGFFQRGLQALARQLHHAEARDLADLHAGAVELQRVAQAVLHVALVALRFHVDEIDDDQAAEVAQAQLACHLFGRLQICAQRGLLDVAAARGARRVDVDGDQRLGVVDDDRAARGQGDLARIRALDLVVDQDLADVGLEVVAYRPDDEARLEVDEERLLRRIRRGAFDRAPQLHQVAQVPVQFLGRAADRCRAGDDAHAIGQLQLVEGVAQLVPVFALDAARDGAADVDVRLEIAAGDFLEREEPVPLLAVVDESGFEAGLDAGDDAFVDVALALLP